jgi:ATP-dependent exoDNAse (exonuclease V) alpha subunit
MLDISKFKDNKEALEVYDIIKNTNESVILSGKAGTGKSTLVKTIIENIHKRHIVVAPTGVAARNINGSTLHSCFNLPIGLIFPESREISNIFYKEEKEMLFRNLQLLIIDEISMCSSFMLDCVDYLLRSVRGIEKPFGGVQILGVGDLFQLTPIIKKNERDILLERYSSELFFDSKAFNKMKNVHKIELQYCYRQTDKKFMSFLDGIRDKSIKLSELSEFNAKCLKAKDKEDRFRITLATTNDKADQINNYELEKLPGQKHLFVAQVSGTFDVKSCVADQFLYLKKSAHVMFIKNVNQLGIYNGMMGIVEDVNNERIIVRTQDDQLITLIEKEKWVDYDYKVNPNTGDFEKVEKGHMLQWPCKLGFCISVNKSQSLTFKSIRFDTAHGCFACGQAYVALSRCQTMEGIELTNKLLYKEIIVNKKVVEFYAKENTVHRS